MRACGQGGKERVDFVGPALDQGERLERLLGDEALLPEGDEVRVDGRGFEAEILGLQLLAAPPVADVDRDEDALLLEGVARARDAGFAFVLLVGDMPYYGRFGFKPAAPGTIHLPGPVDPARLLVLELEDGALDGVSGQVSAYAN